MIDLEKSIKEFLTPIIRESLLEAMGKSRVETSNGNSDNDIGGLELAMEVTKLAKPTIYKLVSNGTLKHYKRGGKLYFKRIDLKRWIEEGESKTKAEIITEHNENKARRNR